jgi:hypothetical protein
LIVLFFGKKEIPSKNTLQQLQILANGILTAFVYILTWIPEKHTLSEKRRKEVVFIINLKFEKYFILAYLI